MYRGFVQSFELIQVVTNIVGGSQAIVQTYKWVMQRVYLVLESFLVQVLKTQGVAGVGQLPLKTRSRPIGFQKTPSGTNGSSGKLVFVTACCRGLLQVFKDRKSTRLNSS